MNAKLLCVCLFLVTVAGVVRGGEKNGPPPLKIGVVDMEKIFMEYYKTKAANAALRKQAAEFQEYLDKLQTSRDKLSEEFKKLRDDALNIALGEVDRESRRVAAQDKFRQLQSKEGEIQQYNRESGKKFDEDYRVTRKKLLNEIREYVEKIGISQQYTLIVDVSGKTLNDISGVVYYRPELDLSGKVIEDLNRGHEDELRKYEYIKMDTAPKEGTAK